MQQIAVETGEIAAVAARPTPLRVVAVASGKGGVGKTNVSANLAVAFGRIMFGDVELADAFAQRCIDHVDAALPAVPLGRNVAKSPREELEARIVERGGKRGCMVADEAVGEPFLPG